MVWDFAEANPFAGAAADLSVAVDAVARAVATTPAMRAGEAKQLDATAVVANAARPMVCTDPPYYDNIGYADLSDFFYVWLRRALGGIYPQLFSTLLTPKQQELVATPHRFSGQRKLAEKHFEDGLAAAFARLRRVHSPEYPLSVFYAFKQAESQGSGMALASTGWEKMLEDYSGLASR
jgi:putative DNA methylase